MPSFIESNTNKVKLELGFCLYLDLTLNYAFFCFGAIKEKTYKLVSVNENDTETHRRTWHTSSEYQGCCFVCLHSRSFLFSKLIYIVRYALMLLFVLCQLPIILTLQWKNLCLLFCIICTFHKHGNKYCALVYCFSAALFI